MEIYRAEKGNIGFYIQPEMIGPYADMGYTIIKMEPVVITDIEREIEIVNENPQEGTVMIEGHETE